MPLIKKSISRIFSSDPSNGSLNLSPDGSSFSVNLYDPVSVPHNAVYCTMTVQSANIWYTTPNISAALDNNTLRIVIVGLPLPFDLVIDDGLYDLPQLQASIYSELNIQLSGQTTLFTAEDLFELRGNAATQKVEILFKSVDVGFIWSVSTIAPILGFTTSSPDSGPGVPVGTIVTSPNIAKFDVFTSFLIHSDLVHSGIPVNDVSSSVLANVFIDVLPGSLINYTPTNPPIVDATELIGAKRSQIFFFLTDQKDIRLDTNDEYWSFTIVIDYLVEA